MNHMQDSIWTLKFFAWIFFILSGLFSVLGTIANIIAYGFDPFWDISSLLMGTVYAAGGFYFVTHTRELLPKRRIEIIKLVSALFVVEIVMTVVALAQIYYNPTSLGLDVANEPQALEYAIFANILSLIFSSLIYMIMIRAINVVSMSTDPHRKPPIWLTIVGWIIVLGFLAAPFVFFL